MMIGELDCGPLKVPVSGLSSLLQGMLSRILSFAKGHRQLISSKQAILFRDANRDIIRPTM